MRKPGNVTTHLGDKVMKVRAIVRAWDSEAVVEEWSEPAVPDIGPDQNRTEDDRTPHASLPTAPEEALELPRKEATNASPLATGTATATEG